MSRKSPRVNRHILRAIRTPSPRSVGRVMPTISRFYGITIQMFFKEHGVPHFHARYGGDMAVYAMETLDRLAGEIPERTERLVREWAGQHRHELTRNWERARAGEPLAPVEPLR